MSTDCESIAQRLHGELEGLIQQVSQVEGAQPSIRDTEEQLWAGMLALGRGLMQLRFEACSTAEVRPDQIEVQGIVYDYQRQSSRACPVYRRACRCLARCGWSVPITGTPSRAGYVRWTRR